MSYIALAELANKMQRHLAASLIIFLDTHYTVCQQRLIDRNRDAELQLKDKSNSFLFDLDQTYRKVLLDGLPVGPGIEEYRGVSKSAGDIFFYNNYLRVYVAVVNNDGKMEEAVGRIVEVIREFYVKMHGLTWPGKKHGGNAFRLLFRDSHNDNDICQDAI